MARSSGAGTQTLFCVPHAGGTAGVFRGVHAHLKDTVAPHPLELPGRGARAAEQPCADFRAAVHDIAARIREAAPPDGWALFGHSMGGLLAYEVVRNRRALGLTAPSRLVISGCAGPGRHAAAAAGDDGPGAGADLVERLVELGGLPREIADDPDAGAYFTGLVRADGRLLAGYRHEAGAGPLDCPLVLLLGSEDPLTDGRTPADWEEAAGRPVRVRHLEGAGHSLVTERPAETARLLTEELSRGRTAMATDANRDRYLDLMKKVLTNVVYEDAPLPSEWSPDAAYDPISRSTGLDWPSKAHTMVGMRRLDNVQFCVEQVLREAVPGDFIETGVWRGGTSIFLRAALQAWGVTDRTVWAADSFRGMPDVTDGAHPGDAALGTHRFNDVMGVPLDTVRRNFRTYGLLDDQVRFLEGWFKDTLPSAPVRELALIRLDGDLYESTEVALESLYPKLSVGGFVIVDDYIIDVCREAVHDFRGRHGITDAIHDIDGVGAYWRRTR
ncbi:alpha/beta fold hydrolase [Streptomyces venezuelae]|uniref:alpha/beta fold hydrolase n=1 Tax=Streptomyces venezuelae TaxID=54571 RepID=UPI00365D9D9A